MAQYLFSYGTLQAELAPAEIAPVVRQLRPIGRASIPGILYDLGDYPGAVVGGTDLMRRSSCQAPYVDSAPAWPPYDLSASDWLFS